VISEWMQMILSIGGLPIARATRCLKSIDQNGAWDRHGKSPVNCLLNYAFPT
jgi:hypothetical protein